MENRKTHKYNDKW